MGLGLMEGLGVTTTTYVSVSGDVCPRAAGTLTIHSLSPSSFWITRGWDASPCKCSPTASSGR